MKHLIIDLKLSDYEKLLDEAKKWRDAYHYTYEDDDPQLLADYLLRSVPSEIYSCALEDVEIEGR